VGYNDLITATGTDPLIPTEQSMAIIKDSQDASIAMRLARRLPDLPRKTRTLKVEDSLATVYMVNGPSGANAPGLKQTSDTSWDDVVLTAEELAVIIPISQEQLDDTMVPIWPEVRGQVASAFSAAFDEACMIGTIGGVAVFTSWPTGGIRAAAVAAGNSVALGAGADAYDDLLSTGGVFSTVEADGFEVNGCVGLVSMKSQLRGLRDLQGNPILNKVPGTGMDYELDGAPMYFPKNGNVLGAATNLIVGDFSKLVYAMRQDVTYTLATEGVITDGAGNVVINLFQQDMVALRAVMRIGFALPNPINVAQTTAASRCPFGVLTT